MPRTPRLDLPDTRHHVMNRGARRDAVFLDDASYAAFLALLAELPDRFGLRVHGYALMSNHYHLLIECPVGGLGRAIQYLQSRYSRWLNRERLWDGPIWRGRYRNRTVEDDVWWMHLLAYLHLNPVRAYLAPTAERARWTSHLAYLGLEPRPDWLTTNELLERFGSIGGLRDYVHEVHIGRERGPADFNPDDLWGTASSAGAEPPLAPVVLRRGPLTLDDAFLVLASITGMGREELLDAPVGPVGSRLRWLALDWLPRATGLPRVELARSLGLHPTVLSRAGQRLRAEREEDEELSELCRRCDEALVAKSAGR